jgi:hypothetical protein
MRRRLPWLAILLLSPLLLAASDPSGDLVSCDGTSVPQADAPIDVVKATGSTAEEGLALRFTITFADPLPVPDEEGSPLRVDVLMLDPAVPDMTVDYYRGLNRIVRFDDVSRGAGLDILLLPERSESPFTSGAQVDGDTLTMTLPSRMVMPDPDLAGFDYRGMRWTVVARDRDTCDLLGGRARPTRRLEVVADSPSPEPSPGAVGTSSVPGDPLVSGGFLAACVLSILVGGAAGFAAARWRRRAG